MATILERFNETTHETFNRQSDTIDVNGRSVATLPIIKEEMTKRSLCTKKEKQNVTQSRVNSLEWEKLKDSPSRSLSPEFLLGSSEKSKQTGPAVLMKPITCVFCNEVLSSQKSLDEHTKDKHCSSDKKWYDCSVCEKRFAHRSSRDIHLRVHTGQRPYECDYCKKRFRVSSHLRDHVRTHTGERPFKCGVCGRGFKQSSDMKKHKKTHFKEMPAVPQTNTEASYKIVRSEDNATSADHSPNELRSPTERQNIKLVIKRERKSTDTKSSMDINTKTVESSNAVESGDFHYSAKSAAHNKKIPGEKSSEVGTQRMEANEKVLATSNLDSNANWAPSWSQSFDNSVPTIKSKENLLKNSPGKVAVKRKLSKGPKRNEKNGYKANSYPSMASGIGQIYSVNNGVNLSQQDSAMISSHNNDHTEMHEPASHQQATTLYNVENQTGNSKEELAAFEKKPSYDDTTAKAMSNQNDANARDDDAFWQPQHKIIKTEKLSPNSHEQSTHCRDSSTPHHEFQTASHKAPTGMYDQLTNIHDRRSNIHEQALYDYEHPSYHQEQSSDINQQATSASDPTVYAHDWHTESSEDHIMNIVNNTEVASTTNDDLTNSGVNSTHDTSAELIARKRTNDNARPEKQALEKTSTEIPKDNVATTQRESKVGHVTSKPGVPVRKPVVVKIRRDKTEGAKTIRKAIKLKDAEKDVKCSVCEQSFKNMDEFNAHKCGKSGKSFKCTICSKIFARQTLLRQHMVLHQGSKRFRFKCNYCGRAFRHRSHLRDHERIHTGERPFKCSFCPKAFKQSSDHRKHENLHTGTTRYRCEKCSLDFKRCDALKRHAMMHTKGEVTLLKCEKCRSLFATADGHMSHVCLNKPYRYRCQICPERFTDADDLRRHCYDLHGEQSTLSCLKCEFCRLEFNTLEKLDEHLGTHRLKKTHRCRTCDQRFSLLNQLVEHVKIHSTPTTEASAIDQSEGKRIEETGATKKDFNQPMKSQPNVKIITHTSNRPARQNYDFIPSKYQPLIPTNPIYGEMSVRNWTRPHNYYLPLRPKEHNVSRKEGKPAPISPRHQPISPQNQPMSPQPNVDVSLNVTISSPSNAESYRRSTEPPEDPAVSFHSEAEPHQRDAELSKNHTIPSGINTEHHQPMSSESSTNELRPFTNSNKGNEYRNTSSTAFADHYPTTAFAAYHAIAMSKSAHRAILDQRRDQEASQNRSTPNQYERTPSRHDTTFSRHESVNRKPKPNVEVSNERDVATGAGKVYPVNKLSDTAMVSPSQVQNNPDPPEIHKNSNESRSYLDVRLQNEIAQSFDGTRTNHGETQRNLDDVHVTSERIRSNSESRSEQNVNLTRSRESLTSENYTANERRSSGRTNSESQSVIKRKYTCLNCRSQFYDESALVDHVCNLLVETMYRCLVCKDDFENYDDLQQHMRTHWKQVTTIKCTLCGERLHSEELLKKHNLKHLEGSRNEPETIEDDAHAYRGSTKDKTQDYQPENLITPHGSARSVTSPVICSVSDNVVTKPKTSERGYIERPNIDDETIPTELTNQNGVRDDVIARSNSGPYIPYYEARKQTHGYFNIMSQGQAMMVSAMHAAMETNGRYPVPNGLLYSPARSRSAYTIEHH